MSAARNLAVFREITEYKQLHSVKAQVSQVNCNGNLSYELYLYYTHHRMKFIYIIKIVLLVNGARSVDLYTDQCPWIKGCTCLHSINPLAEGRLAVNCFDNNNPGLNLLPSVNPWSINIIKCRISNVSLLHYLSETKAIRIQLGSNEFPGHSELDFDWQWVPATTANLSITSNGFYGLRDANKTGNDCNITKFKNPFSFSAKMENFAAIPSCLPKTTRRLHLQDLPKSTKPLEKIAWPPNLHLLKLSNSGVGNYSSQLFSNVPPTLQLMWISNDNLSHQHWMKGLRLQSIKHLILMRSRLSSLPEEEMKRIYKANRLQALNLAFNEFTDIPSNLPSSLKTLRMNHNNIKFITTRHWSTLTNLRQLDLSSNKLTSVPMKLPATLTEIELRSNLIKYSNPRAFVHLKNLFLLNLENNSLTTLPRGVQPGIQLYTVGNNRISHVRDSSEYEFCINCTHLKLHGNPWQCDLRMILMMKWLIANKIGIYAFHGIGRDQSMKTRCQQTDWAGITSTDGRSGITIAIDFMMYFDQPPNDKCFYDLKNLKCLNAGLQHIPDRIPPGLARIHITDNSKLDTVPDYAFADQRILYSLNLDNNSLEHFPYGLPKTVKYLSMKRNRIGEWNDRDLKTILNLTLLRAIYLEDNNIKVLYDWQFEGLHDLNWIGLSGNPLHCDCSMESLSVLVSNIAGYDRLLVARPYPTCATPPDKKRRDIRSLFGFYRYSDCVPRSCITVGNIMNCSKEVQTDKMHVFYTETAFQPGKEVVLKANTFWRTLVLTGLGLKSEQIAYVNLTQLQHIDLSDNFLTEIPIYGLPQSIKVVNLTRNIITRLPTHKEISLCLPNIQVLDLRYNSIKIIGAEVSNLEVIPRVFLEGNPLQCVCASRPLIHWMHVNRKNYNMTQRHGLQDLRCTIKDNKRIYQIMKIQDDDYCQEFPVVVVVCGVVFGVFFLLVGIFLLNFYAQKRREYKVKEQILLGFEGLLEKERQASDVDPETGVGIGNNKIYKFDAFISYDPNGITDAEFVISLMEELEDKRGYTLCLNERDFIPGAGITDNIVECIGESKHIILILSNSFASSPWCQYEVQVSLAELHRRRKSQFIISLLLEEDTSYQVTPSNMKNFLSLVSAIEVPKLSQHHEKEWKEFWEALVKMMPQIPNSHNNQALTTYSEL